MTIKEYILKGTIKSAELRLQELKDIDAPQIMIDKLQCQLDKLYRNELKIGGDLEVLDEELTCKEIKTGKNGKAYIKINQSINFFPEARYGMYIKKADY